MIQESEIIPYRPSNPPGERVIVIAPHPDDETLGCGGTISLLLKAGKKVKVIFLTSGDKADPRLPESGIPEYALTREKEAEKALKVLGVSDFQFLRFPDRGLHERYEVVLHALLKIVGEFGPDAVYSPSMIEVNPDHRTSAALAMDIQRPGLRTEAGREGPAPVRTVFYEVTTPLRPNVLVDVSSVYGVKEKAVRRYKSQLKLMDYLGHIAAMNTIRALTVSGARYVEAFWVVDHPPTEEEMKNWLGYGETLKTD